MSTPRLLACVVLVGALALGACGKEGQLDRPAPLFGAKAKAEYRAQQAREAAARRAAKATAGDPAPPPPDYQRGDPSLDPMRASPVPGAPSTPFDHPNGGGALPDPFDNPNAQPR